MAEGGYAQKRQGSSVAVIYTSVIFNDCNTCLDMVQHLSEVLLLFHDLTPFLVEDIAQSVEGFVESSVSETLFVKSEVQFLVFQCVQHIIDLSPHPLCSSQ